MPDGALKLPAVLTTMGTIPVMQLAVAIEALFFFFDGAFRLVHPKAKVKDRGFANCLQIRIIFGRHLKHHPFFRVLISAVNNLHH